MDSSKVVCKGWRGLAVAQNGYRLKDGFRKAVDNLNQLVARDKKQSVEWILDVVAYKSANYDLAEFTLLCKGAMYTGGEVRSCLDVIDFRHLCLDALCDAELVAIISGC